MADLDQIYEAIRHADAAGDSASVQKLGSYLKSVNNPQPPTYWQRVTQAGKDFDKTVGPGVGGYLKAAEAAGEVGVDMLTGVVGDVAGADVSVLTQDPKKGESVRKAISMTPGTEAGKAGEKYIGEIASPVSNLLKKPVDALEKSGHPIAAQYLKAGEDVAGTEGLGKMAGESTVAAKLKGAVSTQDKVQGIVDNLAGGKSVQKADVGATVGQQAGATLTKAKAAGTAAYQELDAAMGKRTLVPLSEARTAAAQLAGRVVVDSTVKSYATKLENAPIMPFEDLKDLRSQISDSMGTDRNVNRQLKILRDAVTKDIDAKAQSLSPPAKAAWDKANSQWKAYVKTEETIKEALGKNWQAKTATDLYQKAFSAVAKDPKKAASVLTAIQDPAARNQFAASMLHQMADKGGEFDGDKFIRQWDAMNPQSRKILFSSVSGGYEANMTKLVANLKRIQEGKRGLVKEISGLGVAAVLTHFLPGLNYLVGGATLAREAYKFGPKALEAYLTSPAAVRRLVEKTTAALEKGGAGAAGAGAVAKRASPDSALKSATRGGSILGGEDMGL
jgi:hypothetical protein